MTIQDAITKVHGYMEKNARAVAAQQSASGLVPSYHAKNHTLACGRITSHLLVNGVDELEASTENMAMLFHTLANHSAWRQRFEGKGIFPKKGEEATAADPQKAADKIAKKMAELVGEAGLGVEEDSEPAAE